MNISQPSVQILPCDEGSTLPATCNCFFCEQQRPCAWLVISRIVEAFERWTLQEAKRTEKRGGQVTTAVSEAKRGQRSSSAKAHNSHPSEKERHEEGRTLQPRKHPSFMDRLRGIH